MRTAIYTSLFIACPLFPPAHDHCLVGPSPSLTSVMWWLCTRPGITFVWFKLILLLPCEEIRETCLSVHCDEHDLPQQLEASKQSMQLHLHASSTFVTAKVASGLTAAPNKLVWHPVGAMGKLNSPQSQWGLASGSPALAGSTWHTATEYDYGLAAPSSHHW